MLDGTSEVLAGVCSGLPELVVQARLGHACGTDAGVTDWGCSDTGHN